MLRVKRIAMEDAGFEIELSLATSGGSAVPSQVSAHAVWVVTEW